MDTFKPDAKRWEEPTASNFLRVVQYGLLSVQLSVSLSRELSLFIWVNHRIVHTKKEA